MDRMKGKLLEHWGRLADNDAGEIRGKRQEMLSKLQEKYGKPR